MTVAQKLIAEGLAQGLQKGRQQGLQKGRQQGLQKGRQQGLEEGMQVGRARLGSLVLQRFGQLPADIEARLRTAAPADLVRWARQVVTAPALERVFA